MNKTIVITLGAGDLSAGFPFVAARLYTENQPQAEQFVGSLPSAPALLASFRIWQSMYRALADRLVLRGLQSSNEHDNAFITDAAPPEDELEFEPVGVTHVSQQSFESHSQQLKRLMNDWLASSGLLAVDRGLRSQLNPTDTIRIIFETNEALLGRLPWHCWDLFKDYPLAEMALSRPDYRRQVQPADRPARSRKQVRILAVVGDRRGIDAASEQQMLAALPDADVKCLITPSRQLLDSCLWDKFGWDIVFFAGHSRTENETGRLYINEQPTQNSLTVAQLEEALKGAIANGLQLAIFNSCDGIGLAHALGQLQIPQMIVMREPVPNRVAQQFLFHFLNAFAIEKLPLYAAMRQARSQLQGLEDRFPGASWLPVLCQNPATEPISWAQLGGVSSCPYKGLSAFQSQDANLFFGREQVVEALVEAVQRQPFVAVTGPSGSGKSSVVFAGLVPQLRTKADWIVCTCRLQARPFEALAEALMPLVDEQSVAARTVNKQHSNQQNSNKQNLDEQTFISNIVDPNLDKQLQTRLRSLDLSAAFQQRPGQFQLSLRQAISSKKCLFIIDQFEELYTLCSERDRQLFIEQLLDAVQSVPAFTLLITLRADFYAQALSDRRFSDALQTGTYNLGPMNKAELKAVIERPAGLRQVVLEPGLTDQLISATQHRAGRLPLLSFVLSELWAQQQSGRLTHSAYQSIGGVETALANYAETTYAQLSPSDQQRSAQVFMQLIEPGAGTEATRRIAPREEIGEKNWALVARLASARLVVTNRQPGTAQETAEIIHEALITAWGRLGYWIQTDADFRRWQENLRRAEKQWKQSGQETEALLRGKQLSIAQDWLQTREQELSLVERSFIRQSIAAQTERQQRTRRRRQALFAGLSAGLLAALGLSAAAWRGWQQASMAEANTQAIASSALVAADQPLDALMSALQAHETIRQIVIPTASVKEIKDSVEIALRQAIATNHETNRLHTHTAATTKIAYSPTGQLIAAASKDKTVTLWDSEGQPLATLKGHEGEIWGVAISPDGQTVVSASNDRTVRRWRSDGVPIDVLQDHQNSVNAVAFHPTGEYFATADQSGFVNIWSQAGQKIRTISAHQKKIDAIAFSPDGQLLATGSGDNTVKIWRLNGELKQTLTGHSDTVRSVAFSPDSQTVASASADETIRLWATSISDQTAQGQTEQGQTEQNQPLRTLHGHNNIVFDVAFSPDGNSLFSASDDKTLKQWHLGTGRSLSTFSGHRSGATSLALSPNGQTLVSSSYDRTVRVWQVSNPLRNTISRHSATVRDVNFDPMDALLASSSTDGEILVRQLQSDRIITLKDTSSVNRIAFSPDGRSLISGNHQGRLFLWDIAAQVAENLPTNDSIKTPLKASHEGWITDVKFSGDGRWIASSSQDGTIKLWQADGTLVNTFTHSSPSRSGSRSNNFDQPAVPVKTVAWSLDGKQIASAGDDGLLRIWRIEALSSKLPSSEALSSEALFATASEQHQAAINSIAFSPAPSPNRQLIASASDDGTILIHRSDGQFVSRMQGHTEAVIDVEFSPDGTLLASSSVDKTVRLWTTDGQLVETLSGYAEGVNGIDFDATGERLAVGSVDGTVSVWNIAPAKDIESLIALSCQQAENYLNNRTNEDANARHTGRSALTPRARSLCKS